MSDVLTEDEAGAMSALNSPRLNRIIDRLVAEVERLRASNEAVAAVAESFLHNPGGPIPKFCIWPNVQIHGGCLKAGRKPFGCESYHDPQCNECRAHDSVAKAILSSFNPAGSGGET